MYANRKISKINEPTTISFDLICSRHFVTLFFVFGSLFNVGPFETYHFDCSSALKTVINWYGFKCFFFLSLENIVKSFLAFFFYCALWQCDRKGICFHSHNFEVIKQKFLVFVFNQCDWMGRDTNNTIETNVFLCCVSFFIHSPFSRCPT